MSPRRSARLVLVGVAWCLATARAAALEITYSGPASISTRGTCHSPYASTVNAALSVAPKTAASAVKVPPFLAAQGRCLRQLKRFKKRVCDGLCTGADTDPVACAVCASATPCDARPVGTDVAATDSVTLDLTYQPTLDGSHQWACTFRLSKDGSELFSGTCATPSLLPLVFHNPNRVYALPFGVTDNSANNWAMTPTSFGGFRGYLFVNQRVLESPDTATSADILGVSGELTYMLGVAWVADGKWYDPWQLGSLTRTGYSCIYAGQLQSGAGFP